MKIRHDTCVIWAFPLTFAQNHYTLWCDLVITSICWAVFVAACACQLESTATLQFEEKGEEEGRRGGDRERRREEEGRRRGEEEGRRGGGEEEERRGEAEKVYKYIGTPPHGHPWKAAAIYNTADTLFGPEWFTYVCVQSNPLKYRPPPYSVKQVPVPTVPEQCKIDSMMRRLVYHFHKIVCHLQWIQRPGITVA